MPSFAVLIPAAGSSSRFGGPVNKLFEMLEGRRVIVRAVEAFAQRADVGMIVIAAQRLPGGGWDIPADVPALLQRDKVRWCAGGDNRAQSVRNALECVPESIEWVAVHDAARPLVSQSLIDRTLEAAVEHGAAVPAMPVALTIKRAVGPLPARVSETLPRGELWAMQTPQIMRRAELLGAFERCPIGLERVTDDVQLLEMAGGEVWLIAGEERNLKITTRADLALATLLLK